MRGWAWLPGLLFGALSAWAQTAPVGGLPPVVLSMDLNSRPPGLSLELTAKGNEPFDEVRVEVAVPEGLRSALDVEGKRVFVASGKTLRGATFGLSFPKAPAGTYRFEGFASTARGESRTFLEVLVPAAQDGPYYVLSPVNRVFRCERLPLKDIAQKLGELFRRQVEVDPNYATTPMTMHPGYMPTIGLVLASAGLTYVRKPDGTLLVMPAVGERNRMLSPPNVVPQADGGFTLHGNQTDCVELLEYLFLLSRNQWSSPDTLRPKPVTVQTDRSRPFDEVLGLLCDAAGWKWERAEDGKYVIRATEAK